MRHLRRGRTAVTGMASCSGRVCCAAWPKPRGRSLVAIDVARPRPRWACGTASSTSRSPPPTSGSSSVLREEEVDTVVHAAFFTNPRRDSAYAHELESIGTLNLLAAAAAAGVKRVVLRSFTAVYGARGHNPNFLTEEHALQPSERLPGCATSSKRSSTPPPSRGAIRRCQVTVLRFAPLFGPGVHTFYTRLFDHRVVPLLMGYDPLVQLLHPEDAVAAFVAAIEQAPGGAFNVVPSRAHPAPHRVPPRGEDPGVRAPPPRLCRRRPPLGGGAGRGPGGFVDYVRYLFVADGEKARRGSASRRATPAGTRSWPTCATAIPPTRARRSSRRASA